MDLTCVGNEKIAWLGSTFLIVQSITYLLTPLLIKAINIKNAWLLLAFIQFVAYLIFLFVKDINLALFITVIYGVSGSRCAFSYTYLAQLVPESHISFVSMLYTGCDTLTILVQSIYFWQVSHYYEHYMIYLIVMSGLVVLLGAIFLVEPPISLLLRG